MAGKDIASMIPPPHKLKGYGGGASKAPPADVEIEIGDGEEAPEDEDREARVSMMQEFMDAAGMKGDAAAACDALDRYLDSRRGS